MVIVKLAGGLGNQMFQYAFYKSLSSFGKDARIDNNTFEKRHRHEYTKLERVFPKVDLKHADYQDILNLGDFKCDYLSKIRRKMFGIRKSHLQENDILYQKEILQLDGDYYLEGYWQSEKYFKQIEGEIRSSFLFQPLTDERNISIANRMRSENSVAIHVRKGNDFQSKSRKNICDVNYYRKAIEKINFCVENPIFYIFSDNFSWCRENLDFIPLHFVEWNSQIEENNYMDMQIMSYCKNNIIANSTFSWWSAWLNENKKKIVIAPNVWFNKKTVKYAINDILPESWVRI